MTKLFITGATGYIGGDAFHAICTAHPDYDVTCLVRSSDKAAQVAKHFPRTKFAYGDLDDAHLIENESIQADVVCNFANASHQGAARAITKGLMQHDASRPGFLIHTSGTGILVIEDVKAKRFGESSENIYNDLAGVSEVTSMPDEAPWNRDHAVLSAAREHPDRVKVAIVCPPAIFGTGRGPGSQRSHQIPELARCTLQKGYGVQVGAGKARWSIVHVHDLSDLFLSLVETAAAGGSLAEWPGKPAVWGPEGYYFSENGELVWSEVAHSVAEEARKQSLIETDEVKTISPEEANNLTPHGDFLWGANSRSRAQRARTALGWKPTRSNLREDIQMVVDVEARRLGMKPGHAKIAAGEV